MLKRPLKMLNNGIIFLGKENIRYRYQTKLPDSKPNVYLAHYRSLNLDSLYNQVHLYKATVTTFARTLKDIVGVLWQCAYQSYVHYHHLLGWSVMIPWRYSRLCTLVYMTGGRKLL
jgi:hypothetical protein